MRDTDHGRTADVRRGAAVTTQALVNVFGNLNAPNAVRDHRRLLWPVTGPALQRRTGVGDGRGLKLLAQGDRKSTRLNSSHVAISYAVFCLKTKRKANGPMCARCI